MVQTAQLPRGTWVWNIGIGQGWDMPDRAGGFGIEDTISRWRRVGELRAPPGASGGAGVTATGVIGIVLQDAGNYSLLLPVERIVQLFTAWGLPVNLLTSAAVAKPRTASRGCGGDVTTVSWSSRSAGVLSAAEECALRPKDLFRECSQCPEMAVVPAGTFMMGSPPREPERSDGEVQVRVTIARPFAVGEFAVTFTEWDACVADGGCKGYRPNDEGWGRNRRPVINVNWDDAKLYIDWLNAKTGKTYRLLSEAEREYVTRAGTTTPFWWGAAITPKQANYDGSAEPYKGGGTKGENRRQTVPVDSFEANPWGLFNVHGNVWEWTDDCWNDSNQGNPGNGSARTQSSPSLVELDELMPVVQPARQARSGTAGDCGRRVFRGGSWGSDPRYLRAADREWLNNSTRNNDLGFRLARTLNP